MSSTNIALIMFRLRKSTVTMHRSPGDRRVPYDQIRPRILQPNGWQRGTYGFWPPPSEEAYYNRHSWVIFFGVCNTQVRSRRVGVRICLTQRNDRATTAHGACVPMFSRRRLKSPPCIIPPSGRADGLPKGSWQTATHRFASDHVLHRAFLCIPLKETRPRNSELSKGL